MINFKKTLLTVSVAAIALGTSAAHANDLINNQASGYVGGDIYQDASPYESLTVEVGSVTAERAGDNTASGVVDGNINQVSRNPGHQLNQLTLQVGAIHADQDAFNNRATGHVAGDIMQEAYGSDILLEARVGSIEATDGGSALDNTADGYVGGSIYQFGQDGSRVKAKIGSLSGPNQSYQDWN